MQTVECFNRHMMILARESRDLTQSGLAKALGGVSQGTISKYESGIKEPTPDFLSDLSKILKYKREFFFEHSRLYGMPPFHYRRRKSLGTKALSKMVAEMNVRRIHLQILLRSYEEKYYKRIPEIDRDEYRSEFGKSFSIEDAARQLRERWMLPEGPIENVTSLLEKNGGIVIPCNFASDLIDAVSQRIDGLPVLFFVNMNAPSDRLRYTLCHELAHVVLHTTTLLEDEKMEPEADAFAGAFLLPKKNIKSQLRTFNLRQVINLKRYWKVSMSAIAMRADKLNLITPHQKKMFFIQMGKLNYRKSEPYEPPKEHPKKINKIINYFYRTLGYSRSELAKILFISEEEFEQMYRSEPIDEKQDYNNKIPHLRIIK